MIDEGSQLANNERDVQGPYSFDLLLLIFHTEYKYRNEDFYFTLKKKIRHHVVLGLYFLKKEQPRMVKYW